MLFKRRFKIDKEMIPRLYPTSKVGLKQMCLLSANGDLEKAQKLYDYMIKDLDELPMFDPVQPTAVQQVKQGVNETFSFVKENQNEIMTVIELVKGLFSKGGGTPAAGASAIPAHVSPIPPIN